MWNQDGPQLEKTVGDPKFGHGELLWVPDPQEETDSKKASHWIFFFDFMNEAWCPWFWKVYYRVMFSDGFCVFSSLFEINFKWFLNFKLGYRSFTRFGRVGTSIFIPKAQFFSKWPAKNQDLTSKDVLRCFLPDPAFPISNIQGSQRV